MVMHFFRNCIHFTVTFIVFASLAGCTRPSQYIVVQSRLDKKNDFNAEEVTASPLYSKMIPKVKSVALIAPTTCAAEPASQATGAAQNKKTLISTACGVEMGELERALVQRGYIVYTWNRMNNAIAANRNITTSEIAKLLGAQVLFQVNSLERVSLALGTDIKYEYSYFESNKFGDILKPIILSEIRANELKPEIENLDSNERLNGVMIDINAVDTETGQSIWFFRNKDFSYNLNDIFSKYLIRCWDGWGCRAETILQQNGPHYILPAKGSVNAEIADESLGVSSFERDQLFKSLRVVTTNFTKRFASGR